MAKIIRFEDKKRKRTWDPAESARRFMEQGPKYDPEKDPILQDIRKMFAELLEKKRR